MKCLNDKKQKIIFELEKSLEISKQQINANIQSINKIHQDEVLKLNKTIDDLVLSQKEKINIIDESKIRVQELNLLVRKKQDEIDNLKESIDRFELAQRKLITPEEHEGVKNSLLIIEEENTVLRKKIEDLQATTRERKNMVFLFCKKK